MAKSKSFFGLRTGSTKTLTFQVLNGKQITKDRVEIVKNPRTQSQMAQRCLMATASAAYTAMRKIVNHSFQGYSYGQQNMSKFISENVFLLRNAVEIGATDYGYNPFRDRSFKPGAYMISKGTLTPTVYTIDAVCETPRIRLTLMDGLLPSNYTANDIAEMMGLSLGEMSTICMIFGSDEAGWNFGFLRIRFIKAGDEPLNDERVFLQHFEVESNISSPSIDLGTDLLEFLIYDNNIRQDWNVYFGAIYSRKSANGWLRSTSYITVPDGTELQPGYETALATYPQETGYILNGAIIPNGGRVKPEPTPTEPIPVNLAKPCAIWIDGDYYLGFRNEHNVPFLAYYFDVDGTKKYALGGRPDDKVTFDVSPEPSPTAEQCTSENYASEYGIGVFVDAVELDLSYDNQFELEQEVSCSIDFGQVCPWGAIKYNNKVFTGYGRPAIVVSDIIE